MSYIVNKEVTLKSISDFAKTTDIIFYFEKSDDSLGVLFNFYDDTLILSITGDNASITDDKGIKYISEPLDLLEDVEYRAECGVKHSYGWKELIVYLRIF